MNPRKIVVLGSTGSIGKSALEVISAHPGRFIVRALAAYSNAEMIVEQYRVFRPEYLCLVDPIATKKVSSALKDEPVRVLSGEDDLVGLASLEDVDIVLNAIVGSAGLKASLATVSSGRMLALANKESLVAGGPLFGPILEKTKAQILPIDSEHSAIWQALRGNDIASVKRLVLTSSGGPFRTLAADQFEDITVEEALSHPTWKMGPKITIDSATLANKGLEVIEAVNLFSIPVEKVIIAIHPQSIVHSMVEFIDSSVMAQMSIPDMRLPITYALFWPERVVSDYGTMNWEKSLSLTFEPPDYKRFPAAAMGIEAARVGGTAPAIYSAANETAVAAFLERSIKFTEIAETIQRTVDKIVVVSNPNLEDILEADRIARETARQAVEKVIW
ncbi:MAG: 1-deoxy-D-xylulose-5-phosphate reductoisomerase [candidate division Zixibacteria bacterium]|nr:1-deoxy-D-xylulose-5-phosphate reductoisomerase [candidate division Zixibacteria bacterium]